MNCCNDYGDCNQGRDCPARKVRAGTHHQLEMPKIEFDCPAPSGLLALLLVLCITFLTGCIWFYKAVV